MGFFFKPKVTEELWCLPKGLFRSWEVKSIRATFEGGHRRIIKFFPKCP